MALTCVVEPGDARIAPLVEEFGAADVWAGLRRPGPVVEWARRAATVDLDRVRGRAEELGLRFLVPGDADWPQQSGYAIRNKDRALGLRGFAG